MFYSINCHLIIEQKSKHILSYNAKTDFFFHFSQVPIFWGVFFKFFNMNFHMEKKI